MDSFCHLFAPAQRKPPSSGVFLGYEEASMEDPQLLSNFTVAEVMDRWPQTVPFFFRYRLACIGCPIAPFETVAEVAAIYGLNLNRFLGELEQTIRQAEQQT
jgi:hybrid cluster-associated redox disulfide protein